MIDFALDAQRNDDKSPRRSDSSSLPPPLPADFDDDHGCCAGCLAANDGHRRGIRTGHPLGISIVRRPAGQPGAYPIHHSLIYLWFDRLQSRHFNIDDTMRDAEQEVRQMNLSTRSSAGLSRRSSLPSSCGCGTVAFFQLPCRRFPKSIIRSNLRASSAPGASPDVVATTVADSTRTPFGPIADVTEMTSSSTVGSTHVDLRFGLTSTSTLRLATCRRRSTPHRRSAD